MGPDCSSSVPKLQPLGFLTIFSVSSRSCQCVTTSVNTTETETKYLASSYFSMASIHEPCLRSDFRLAMLMDMQTMNVWRRRPNQMTSNDNVFWEHRHHHLLYSLHVCKKTMQKKTVKPHVSKMHQNARSRGLSMSFTAVGQLEQHVALLLQPVLWCAVTCRDVGQLQWPLVTPGDPWWPLVAPAAPFAVHALLVEGQLPPNLTLTGGQVSHGVPLNSVLSSCFKG